MVSPHHVVAESDEIDQQLSGYWIAPWAPIPDAPPSYRPTGAVLPKAASRTDQDFTALDLVSVEYAWLPLSEAGRYTYSHSAGLLHGERWRFAAWRDGSPTVYEASYDPSLDPASVEREYGIQAARRCRQDRPVVQLRLRVVSASA